MESVASSEALTPADANLSPRSVSAIARLRIVFAEAAPKTSACAKTRSAAVSHRGPLGLSALATVRGSRPFSASVPWPP